MEHKELIADLDNLVIPSILEGTHPNVATLDAAILAYHRALEEYIAHEWDWTAQIYTTAVCLAHVAFVTYPWHREE